MYDYRLRKNSKRILSVLLVFAMLMLCGGNSAISSYAAVTKESIKQKENQITNAKKERESMKSSLTDLQTVKKNLEAEKSDLKKYITELDANLTQIQNNIDELQGKIEEKEQKIEETEAELEEAIETQNTQYEEMKDRIRFMYEKGETMYFELLAESESFGDMLNKADYIEKLSAYDRQKLEEYIAHTELVEMTKTALEEEKETLDQAKADQLIEEDNMKNLLAQKNSEVSKVSANIADKEAAIKEYEAQIAEENATIAALEKAVEADKAELAAQNARKYDGGVFTFPCPSYTRISDDYGMRMHPTLGIQKMHNGIDLAAASGSAILAAYDGKVVAAAYNSTMGNYIMIDHGSGLYTIYMHASSLSVSTGAEVKKGQKIAAVGSTGRSTGPHLHFGVRSGGNYVSPWNYLK
ncbi:murein hydrolase activator EnvC family protein [Butyrivibrio sp. MB2005]|uniref:murein hydrolase activator EnvC family protein n=1 Tax=Butyrivibrio sp. MB2005 TaxID=1280678 RepID=UPI0003FC2FD1|nr:peptidoglycan DD-metalloendopeptidase family protein [Butyrivibrio sp. MB2005]